MVVGQTQTNAIIQQTTDKTKKHKKTNRWLWARRRPIQKHKQTNRQNKKTQKDKQMVVAIIQQTTDAHFSYADEEQHNIIRDCTKNVFVNFPFGKFS